MDRLDPHRIYGLISQSYDRISREYGWTDDQIGELTMARFAQIDAAVGIREYDEQRRESDRMAFMLYSVTKYVVLGAQIDQESKQGILDGLALELTTDPISKAYLKERDEWDAAHQSVNDVSRGGAPGNLPAIGSFERFMGALNSTR